MARQQIRVSALNVELVGQHGGGDDEERTS